MRTLALVCRVTFKHLPQPLKFQNPRTTFQNLPFARFCHYDKYKKLIVCNYFSILFWWKIMVFIPNPMDVGRKKPTFEYLAQTFRSIPKVRSRCTSRSNLGATENFRSCRWGAEQRVGLVCPDLVARTPISVSRILLFCFCHHYKLKLSEAIQTENQWNLAIVGIDPPPSPHIFETRILGH